MVVKTYDKCLCQNLCGVRDENVNNHDTLDKNFPLLPLVQSRDAIEAGGSVQKGLEKRLLITAHPLKGTISKAKRTLLKSKWAKSLLKYNPKFKRIEWLPYLSIQG